MRKIALCIKLTLSFHEFRFAAQFKNSFPRFCFNLHKNIFTFNRRCSLFFYVNNPRGAEVVFCVSKSDAINSVSKFDRRRRTI